MQFGNIQYRYAIAKHKGLSLMSMVSYFTAALLFAQLGCSLAGDVSANQGEAEQIDEMGARMMRGTPGVLASAPGKAITYELCAVDQLARATSDEEQKPKCKPPEERSCANKCDGEYGMLCPFSTVCDPIKHRCEKAQP